MCFFNTTGNVRTAKRDITCYKVVMRPIFYDGQYQARFFDHFWYKEGEVNELEIPLIPYRQWYDEYTVERGFHSYSDIDKAWSYVRFGSRFHGLVLVECTIPAGANYLYSRKNQEYVSNKIIVNKEISK